MCIFIFSFYFKRIGKINMAKGGINKVILIGNLGADPDVRYAPNGTSIANISIATSEQWKDKETGENKERTEWHRIVFFGKLADIVSSYLKKGAKIYVEGRLQTRKWQNQERYTTEIIANDLQMLGGGLGKKNNLSSSEQDRVKIEEIDNIKNDIPF